MNRTRLVFLLTFLALQFDLLTAQNIPPYLPSNGLVGWWPFNGNANDESGNGNHGVVNGPALTSDRNGESNKAFSFDGVNDFIDINDSGLSSTGGLSMSAWFYWKGSNGVTQGQFIYQIANNPNGSIEIGDDGKLAINVVNCNCANDIGAFSYINVNTWNHIVLSYELVTGTMKMYLNGQLVSTIQENLFSYFTVNNSPSRLGNYHFNSFYFNGIIDDSGLWNRALTAQEVTNLYNGFTPPSVTTTTITNINTTSATSGGNITSDGGSSITARGVVWSTSPNPTTALSTKTSDGTGTGTFSSSLTGLTPNNKYYVRAYATNAAGTIYGNEVSFTTKSECLPDYIPTDGLVGYWPFCGNANDESGNGNHGVVNGATLTTDRNGNANQTYSFDGVNDYILIDDVTINTEYSISAWILANNSIKTSETITGSNSGATFISQGASNNPCNYCDFGLGLKSGPYYGGSIQCQSIYYNFERGSNCSFVYYADCSATFNNFGNWDHVLYVSKANKLSFYINGQLIWTLNNVLSLNHSGYPLSIGTRYVANNINKGFGWWDGKLDDISIWNRALTAEEIHGIYNGGCTMASFVNPPSDITLSCADAAVLQASPGSLSYTNNVTGTCEISGSVTGVITGTADECGGNITQTWSFTDDSDRTITHVQAITVSPAPQAAWVNPPVDITISCDAATSFTASSISYTNNGTGDCLISGSVTGVLGGNFNKCGGTLTQTWTFTDACGREISNTQSITVEPGPQADWINSPVDVTISCDEASRFVPTSLSFTNIGLGTCLIAGTVNPVVTRNYDDCGGTIDAVWAYQDECGRIITHLQRTTVLPRPAVAWVNPPADITVSCAEAGELAPTFLAYSNNNAGFCLQSGYILSTFNAATFNCGTNYTQTWAYTDQCNRSISHTQQITVGLPDQDGDNAPDATDNCPETANATQVDTDADGVGNACDNCPNTSNASQADCNGNGIGDACDVPDADCDSIPDATDNCPEYPNPNQTDLNSNGTGDACETGKRFGINTTTPQSEVHVSDGSVYIDNPDKGIIMKGADGKCYKLSVHNGALKLLIVPCPESTQNR
ncbi:MAG: thrombospondin type 3 repeat-containing protein [Saprospiraceae bacterium]|jgi:hypothetical protein|nr:thrombospondin type 3 repeat-containing protein [Saprospiraceae bacterium]